MKFNINNLDEARLAPKQTTINVGRFQVAITHDQTMLGGFRWQIENHDAVREGEFPLSGKIYHGPDAVTLVTLFLAEIARYEEHLLIEEAIAADPERYKAEAEKALKKEEAAAAKAQAKADAEAQAAQEAAEATAAAAANAEAIEAKRLANEKAEWERDARRLKLEQRIRDSAARELAAS